MPRRIPDISPEAIDALLSGQEKTTETPEEIQAGVEAYNRLMEDFGWDEQSVRKSSLTELEELSTVHMKMAGLIPATDEERLRLMQEVDKIPLEEAKELLAAFKARER